MRQAILKENIRRNLEGVIEKNKIIIVHGVITCTTDEVRDQPLYLCEVHNLVDGVKAYLELEGDEVYTSYCGRTIESYYEEHESDSKRLTWILDEEIEFLEGNANGKYLLETWRD